MGWTGRPVREAIGSTSEEVEMLYDVFKYGLFRPVVKYGFRARLEGAENVPATGGAILASNHIAEAETFTLPALLKRHLTFPAKAELFKGDRGLGSKVVAWFMRSIQMVPLDRSGGRTSLAGLEPVLEVLREGGLVGIYPEGTRSPDGRLYKGRTGVARMALAAGVPVIPVGVIGTKAKKIGPIPWVSKPVIRIGKPMDFSAYAGGHDDRATLRWITDEVMNEIMKLTGQTYVDAYGTSVKSGSMTAEEAQARVKERPGGQPAPPVPPTAQVS